MKDWIIEKLTDIPKPNKPKVKGLSFDALHYESRTWIGHFTIPANNIYEFDAFTVGNVKYIIKSREVYGHVNPKVFVVRDYSSFN